MRCAWAAALGGALLVCGAAGPSDPGRSWRDGPVRLLLDPGEYRAFGRLRDAAERVAFVEQFWASRDSQPQTAENEFRMAFEARVREAEERFVEPGRRGWRTDRGRAWVLLGPPDEIRHGAAGPEGRRREIWWYRKRPGGGGALELVFEADRQGRMRLRQPEPWQVPQETTPADAVSAALARQRLRQQLRQRLRTLGPVELDQLAALLEIPRATRLSPFPVPVSPGRMRRPGASVPRVEVFERFLPELKADDCYFFRAADGSVVALASFEVELEDPAQLEELWGSAWLLPPNGTRPTAVAKLAARAMDERRVVFGGRLHVFPGRYRLRLAFGDRTHGEMLLRSRELRVPALGRPGLQSSSLVPAEGFGHAAGADDPFAVGSGRVVPRPTAVFDPGEPLRLYLQVYGAVVDPVTEHPSMDVRFSFARVRGGRLRRHGKPLEFTGATGTSLGLALPVGTWPPGEYRVRVRIYDRLSGRSVETEGGFTIRERESG